MFTVFNPNPAGVLEDQDKSHVFFTFFLSMVIMDMENEDQVTRDVCRSW